MNIAFLHAHSLGFESRAGLFFPTKTIYFYEIYKRRGFVYKILIAISIYFYKLAVYNNNIQKQADKVDSPH